MIKCILTLRKIKYIKQKLFQYYNNLHKMMGTPNGPTIVESPISSGEMVFSKRGQGGTIMGNIWCYPKI